MAETLKPCPFCGGEAKEFSGEDAAPHRWTVECESCGAHVGSDTRHKARAKWNRRAERTCSNISNTPGGFRCSACGTILDGDPEYCLWLDCGDMTFCPSCGARVVGE